MLRLFSPEERRIRGVSQRELLSLSSQKAPTHVLVVSQASVPRPTILHDREREHTTTTCAHEERGAMVNGEEEEEGAFSGHWHALLGLLLHPSSLGKEGARPSPLSS